MEKDHGFEVPLRHLNASFGVLYKVMTFKLIHVASYISLHLIHVSGTQGWQEQARIPSVERACTERLSPVLPTHRGRQSRAWWAMAGHIIAGPTALPPQVSRGKPPPHGGQGRERG